MDNSLSSLVKIAFILQINHCVRAVVRLEIASALDQYSCCTSVRIRFHSLLYFCSSVRVPAVPAHSYNSKQLTFKSEQPDARGGELFDKVCNHLNLGEKDYFSMTFWLDKEVRVASPRVLTQLSCTLDYPYSTRFVLFFRVHLYTVTTLAISHMLFHFCSFVDI